MAYSLLQLPHEVLHCILIHVNPEDLAALRCCRGLSDFIGNDRLLFKEIFERHFVGSLYPSVLKLANRRHAGH